MLRKQITFLEPGSTLASLPAHDFQVTPDKSGNVVSSLFEQNPDIPGIIVADGAQLVGLISRRKFLEHITQPFGPEVYLGRPIEILVKALKTDLLQFPSDYKIDEAARIALERPMELVYEPVVVEFPNYDYRLLDIYVLLLAQSHLLTVATKVIREQKEATEEANRGLQAANERLKELDQLKTDFLSTVSHELRTPLTSVLGFAKIIKKRLDKVLLPQLMEEDKQTRKAFRQIRENINIIAMEGERLTNLINDVLDIAKMEAGKVEWKMSPLSLGEVMDRAIIATTGLFNDNSHLTLIKNIEDDLPDVMGDRDRLIQIVINFISNAVKFTDEGAITCRVYQDGDMIVSSITDTGVGLSAEDRAKVFERFKQVGDTLTNKPKGTGLGLAICKQIVDYHGGEIWVESELGQGSTFLFSLPVPPANGTEPIPADEQHTLAA